MQAAIEEDIEAQGQLGAAGNASVLAMTEEECPGPAPKDTTVRTKSSDSGRGHSSFDALVGIQVRCKQKISKNVKGPEIFN